VEESSTLNPLGAKRPRNMYLKKKPVSQEPNLNLEKN
jgi:hypothetical protein